MIDPETRVRSAVTFMPSIGRSARLLSELGVHPDTVSRAIECERFHRAEPLRPSILDPYLEFVRQTLEQHPRLRATRIYQMLRDRGYTGSVVQLRRAVARLRPPGRKLSAPPDFSG